MKSIHYNGAWECRNNQYASDYKSGAQGECYECAGIFRGKRDFEICKDHGKKERIGVNKVRYFDLPQRKRASA